MHKLAASKVLGSLLLLLLAVLGMASCGGGTPGGGGQPAPCTVTGVTVSATPSSVAPGTGSTLSATVASSGGCANTVTWTASPAGGVLTVSGNSATFTAANNGTYTVIATSTDNAAKAGSAIVTVTAGVACGTPNGTVVTHSASIAASEIWAGDGVLHRIPNSIAINGSSVVTIEPCAIVALGQNASITVNGTATLLAAGTSATRYVTFTRLDPNQPWGILRGASATSLIDLHWTVVEGGGSFGGQYDNPAIAAVGNGYFVAPVPVLRVDNVVIDGPQGVGIYLDANAAFTPDSQQLFITRAASYPVELDMMALGSLPTGTYTGNAIDEIFIVGPSANVFDNLTIHNRGVPVRIKTAGMNVGPAGNLTHTVTLTIEPGVTLKFPKASAITPGARVIFGRNGNDPNNVVGVLNAVGTPTAPIVFTSGEAVPAPGDWVGLWLDTATGSRLDHVEISYAGADSGISSANCRPLNTRDNAALIVGDFSTQYVPPSDLITNSVIANSAGFGIDAVWQAPVFNSPDLTATNVFQNNAGCAQTYNAVSPPGICPVQRGCTRN